MCVCVYVGIHKRAFNLIFSLNVLSEKIDARI